MKIGVAMTFGGGFSGGRLHAFLLGAELAAQGHEVTFVCNEPPGFIEKMPPVPGKELLRFVKLKFDLLRWPQPLIFDLWIIVHERSLNGRFFAPVFENARRQATPLLLLTFETPNWQESMMPSFRVDPGDALLSVSTRLGAQCLSSTDEGRGWARRYFPDLPPDHFHVLSPPVTAQWYPGEVERDERLILAFTRRASPHKGYDTILRVLNARLRGRRIVLIDGYGGSLESRRFVAYKRQHDGLDIETLANIAENEKHRLLKAARVLLYPSAFEGFGLPPGEARYWGTPVIAYDLPVLREAYGDSLCYVPAGDVSAFEEALHRELAASPDFSPAPEARRVGDPARWSADVRRVLAAVMDRARPALALAAPVDSAEPHPVILDQLGNWNKADTAAALQRTLDGCTVISFDREVYAQTKSDRDRRMLPPGDTLLPVGDAGDALRVKLLAGLEAVASEVVFLTEDLLVCPVETVRAAVATLLQTGAAGAAIPVRWHYQDDGMRHYRTARGDLLAACGVFRRAFLVQCLRDTDVTGCRSQPVLDVSYLVLAAGGRIVAASGEADRLPPRTAPTEFDLLPGGAGTWHEAFRRRTGQDTLIEPLPCRQPDDADELRFACRFRNDMEFFLAEFAGKTVSRRRVAGMLGELVAHCPLWRSGMDLQQPLRTCFRFQDSYLRYGRHFLSNRHMTLFVRSALVALARERFTEDTREFGPQKWALLSFADALEVVE